MVVMDPAVSGDFGSGWVRDSDDEPFESAHDAPIDGDHLSSGMLGAQAVHEAHGLIDAAESPFHFDPVDMDSHDDFDLNGDGLVDHHDVHSALHGLHDFHAPEHAAEQFDHLAHDPAHDVGFFHH